MLLASLGLLAYLVPDQNANSQAINLASVPFSCRYESRFEKLRPELRLSEQVALITFVVKAHFRQANVRVELGNLPEERSIPLFVERRIASAREAMSPFSIGESRLVVVPVDFNNSIDGMMSPTPPPRGGYLVVDICRSHREFTR